jgi:hypothetical protein
MRECFHDFYPHDYKKTKVLAKDADQMIDDAVNPGQTRG